MQITTTIRIGRPAVIDAKSNVALPGWKKRGMWANARRQRAARRRILAAIAILHNAGCPLTYRAIRERASGGSFSTIASVLRLWRRMDVLPVAFVTIIWVEKTSPIFNRWRTTKGM